MAGYEIRGTARGYERAVSNLIYGDTRIRVEKTEIPFNHIYVYNVRSPTRTAALEEREKTTLKTRPSRQLKKRKKGRKKIPKDSHRDIFNPKLHKFLRFSGNTVSCINARSI